MTTDARSRTSRPTNGTADPIDAHGTTGGEVRRRRTASAWIAGGALWTIAGLLYSGDGWRFRSSSAVFLAADVVLALGIIGLLGLRLHGASRPATVALRVALVARLVFAAAEVSGLVSGTDDAVLLPIAGLVTAASSIAFAALARRAHRRLRVASLAMGLYFVVVMMPFAIATGEPPALALAGWGVPAVFSGLAIGREAVAHRRSARS